MKNMNILGMCFDKRVLIGLGALAVGLWFVAPAFLLAALPFLLLAACPLSMLFMKNMNMGGEKAPVTTDPAARLAALESAQGRLTAEIARARAETAAAPGETKPLPERVPDRARI